MTRNFNPPTLPFSLAEILADITPKDVLRCGPLAWSECPEGAMKAIRDEMSNYNLPIEDVGKEVQLTQLSLGQQSLVIAVADGDDPDPWHCLVIVEGNVLVGSTIEVED